MSDEQIDGLATAMSLGSAGWRQQGYVAGAIAARRYEFAAGLDEAALRVDRRRFLGLYDLAIQVKRRLLLERPGAVSTPSTADGAGREDAAVPGFKPENDSDYRAVIPERQMMKTRRHATLVRAFNDWLTERGFAATNQDRPKDLVVRRGSDEWLVEAKVVRSGDATAAVRAALAQLLMYRHFFYDSVRGPVSMVALFTESVGPAYLNFLEHHGISTIWKDGRGWKGSDAAISRGLVDR